MASDELFDIAKNRAKEIGSREEAIRRLPLVPSENRALVMKAIREVYPLKSEPIPSFVEGLAGLDPESVEAQIEAQKPLVALGLPIGGQLAGGALGTLLGGPAGTFVGEASGGAIGEKLSQLLGASEPSNVNVALAGAAPGVGRGVVRGARAVGRTATRLVPALFRGAQAKAFQAADELLATLKPSESAGRLFTAARAAGTEKLQAAPLISVLDDVAKSIGDDPVNPGLKLVGEYVDRFRGKITGGTIDLQDLMQLRLDLGRSLGTRGGANELGALYGGAMESLKQAAKSGGKGAEFAQRALDVFKKDLGAIKFKAILESSQVKREAALGAGEALNIRALAKQVRNNREELGKLLGEGGLNLIDAFVDQYRSLPPEHALNYANSFMALIAGGAGILGTGAEGVALGLVPELIKNVFAVGKNPAAAARIAGIVAQAARVGVVQQVSDVTP